MSPLPKLEFRALLDDHPLRIEVAAGSTRTLVVSMTSVGTSRHDWPPKEFVKIGSQGGLNHVICITDISRSWMNGTGLVDQITDTISDYVMKHQINELVGLGTSMGAYNLLVQGLFMPFTRIIALAPQYSVHPEIMPDEKRWHFFRKLITEWPHPELATFPKQPCQIVMMHGDTKDEQRHWRKMPNPTNLQHFIFPDSDHNFPRSLREAGDLDQILKPALQGRFARMASALHKVGAMTRADYEIKHRSPS